MNTQMPQNKKFLCIKAVEHKISFKKSWIYEQVKAGTFPQPIKISGATRWLESSIDEWMDQCTCSVNSVESTALSDRLSHERLKGGL